jgi:predicted metal-dependent enzyme (double-stranded beta helix superfamily)
MNVAEERSQAIAEALDRVRAIEAEQGVSPRSLEAIRSVMIGVATRPELFPAEEFPLPEDGSGERFDVLSVDDDGRFELYLEVADKDVSTPPHDHTTWAVVTGIRGLELNKVYEGDGGPKGEAPLKVDREVPVKAGTGVCLMPDDFHSIHIAGGELNMHLHLYGLGFAHLKGRRMFDEETGEYRGFDYLPE